MNSNAPPFDPSTAPPSRFIWLSSGAAFALLLVSFWLAAIHFAVRERIHGHLPTAFAGFALLLAPYWFFGFGAAGSLRQALRSRVVRILAPALLIVPYLLFSVPRAEFRWTMAGGLAGIPVAVAAVFELTAAGPRLAFADAFALCALGLPVEFHWFAAAWPYGGLSALPKLLLLDAALYAYLVVRRLPGIGFDFRLRLRDIGIALREWSYFAPVVISLGLALHFIVFHAWWPPALNVVAAWLVTFFFVAVPEELFFRGLLQNLLETRFGRWPALFIAAPIFGLSHFNKGAAFNWRYVILAAIAGIFYGRAWMYADRADAPSPAPGAGRIERRVLASAITHTMVDVVWGLWFRA
jgi:membrane protease YdiL (CAAX protease family)